MRVCIGFQGGVWNRLKIQENSEKFRKIRKNSEKFGKIQKNSEKFRKIWKNSGKIGEQNIKSGEISGVWRPRKLEAQNQ